MKTVALKSKTERKEEIKNERRTVQKEKRTLSYSIHCTTTFCLCF